MVLRSQEMEESCGEAVDSDPDGALSGGQLQTRRTVGSYGKCANQKEGIGEREEVDPGEKFIHQKGRGEKTVGKESGGRWRLGLLWKTATSQRQNGTGARPAGTRRMGEHLCSFQAAAEQQRRPQRGGTLSARRARVPEETGSAPGGPGLSACPTWGKSATDKGAEGGLWVKRWSHGHSGENAGLEKAPDTGE